MQATSVALSTESVTAHLLPPVPKRCPPLSKAQATKQSLEPVLWTIDLIIQKDSVEELERFLKQNPLELTKQNEAGQTLLMRFVQERAFLCAKHILPQVDVQVKDSLNRTALHYLCKMKQPGLVVDFLKIGLSARQLDHHNWSPLHYAVSLNNATVVAMLKNLPSTPYVVNYYDELFQPKKQTPLHLASALSTEVLKEVLTLTKKIDLKDHRGMTPLHHAVMSRSALENVQLLLDRGADPNVIDDTGQTPLGLACQLEKPLIAALLLNGKAQAHNDQNALPPLVQVFLTGDIKLAKDLVKHGASADARWGQYALIDIVAALGDKKFEELLISAKATLTPFYSMLRNSYPTQQAASKSPIFVGFISSQSTQLSLIQQKKHTLVAKDDREKNSLLHQWIIKDDTDLQMLLANCTKSDWELTNTHGDTPFLHCCRKGPVKNIVQLLKAHPLNLACVDTEGNTALHIALKRGDLLLLFLLAHHLPHLLNQKNKNGDTALHLAILMGLRPAIDVLLKCGANPNIADSRHNTALHLISHASIVNVRQIPQIIASLVRKKGNLEAKNSLGQTPLEYAMYSNKDVFYSLLQQGANPNCTDAEGKSLLVKACEKNLFDPAQKLVMFGAKRDGKEPITPLIAACRGGYLAFAQLLLDKKVASIYKKSKRANPNRSRQNDTPLTAIIDKIVRLKANSEADHEGNNPLINQAYEVLKLLLRSGAKPNKTVKLSTGTRLSPLLLATRERLENVVTLLLDKGADPNYKVKQAEFPLSVACRNGDIAIASRLINKGAIISSELCINRAFSVEIRTLLNSTPMSQGTSKREPIFTQNDDYIITDDDVESYHSSSNTSTEVSDLSDEEDRGIYIEIEELTQMLDHLGVGLNMTSPDGS